MTSSFLFKILFSVLISFSALASGQYGRLIVIGDSLSDMGTYSKMAGPFGGGKFTTNPGKIWIEIIAEKYDLPLQVNRYEGFGTRPVIVGGFNYAQGGARIATNVLNTDNKSFSARSLTTQLGYFLETHKTFKADDLVFVLGGPNDVFATIRDGSIKPEVALTRMAETATDLLNMVAKMKAHGAKNVVVINLPAINETPMAYGMNEGMKNLIKEMVFVFNGVVALKTEEIGFKLIDFHSFDVHFNQYYQDYGFKNIQNPACRLNSLPIKSAVVCATSKHLVEPKADITYKFADQIHPTTGYSKLAADFVWSELQKVPAHFWESSAAK